MASEPPDRLPLDPDRLAREPDATPGRLHVEPQRLGARPLAKAQPAVVAVVLVAFVGLALAKPWATAQQPIPSAGRASAAPPASAAAPVASRAPTSLPTDAELLAAARPRAQWGVRAIVMPAGGRPVADGTGHGLEERWLAVDAPGGAASDTEGRVPGVLPGEAVLALGVTTPHDFLPLDVHFWRFEPDGVPRAVVPTPVHGPDPGSWLWRPRPDDATDLGAWPAGTYRIDVLLGPRIIRMTSVVPGEQAGAGPQPPTGILNGIDFALSQLPDGPVVIADGRAQAVAATPADPMTELEAWMRPGIEGPQSLVGSVSSAAVYAIGAIVEGDGAGLAADLRMIAPATERVATVQVIFPSAVIPVPQRTAIMLVGAGRQPLAAGLYQLTVSSRRPYAPASTTWHVEILPATRPTPPGSPLAMLRRWLGREDPRVTGGEPVVTDRDRGDPDGDGTCGGRREVRSTDQLVGVVPSELSTIQGIRLFAAGSDVPIDTRISLPAGGAPALVAFPRGGLAAGTYRLEVTRSVPGGTVDDRYSMCVTGVAP
jgi:hypothetical protein